MYRYMYKDWLSNDLLNKTIKEHSIQPFLLWITSNWLKESLSYGDLIAIGNITDKLFKKRAFPMEVQQL